MEAFKAAWVALDTSASGKVASTKMAAYLKRQGYEDTFVNKWLRVFEADRNGDIHADSFCDVLGFDVAKLMNECREAAAQRRAAQGDDADADEADADGGEAKPKLPEVQFLAGDMDESWQAKIVEVCYEGLQANQQMKDVPKWVKSKLDRDFSQLWHVVIASGQFWCFYGHEPGMAYTFQLGKHVFIVFKTPGC